MKLKDFLKYEGISVYKFSKITGIHFNTLHNYIHGLSYPRHALLKKIESATEGKVTAQDYDCTKVRCPTCKRYISSSHG